LSALRYGGESLNPAYLPPANFNTLARTRWAIRHGRVCPRFPCLTQSPSPGTHRCFCRFTCRASKLNRLAASPTVNVTRNRILDRLDPLQLALAQLDHPPGWQRVTEFGCS